MLDTFSRCRRHREGSDGRQWIPSLDREACTSFVVVTEGSGSRARHRSTARHSPGGLPRATSGAHSSSNTKLDRGRDHRPAGDSEWTSPDRCDVTLSADPPPGQAALEGCLPRSGGTDGPCRPCLSRSGLQLPPDGASDVALDGGGTSPGTPSGCSWESAAGSDHHTDRCKILALIGIIPDGPIPALPLPDIAARGVAAWADWLPRCHERQLPWPRGPPPGRSGRPWAVRTRPGGPGGHLDVAERCP